MFSNDDDELNQATIRREVLHTMRPNFGWLGIALIAILGLQSMLMLIIALQNRTGATDSDRLAAVLTEMKQQRDVELRDAQLTAREDMLDEMLTLASSDTDNTVAGPRGLVEHHRSLNARIRQLENSELLLAELAENHRKLQADLKEAKDARSALARRNEGLRAQLSSMERQLKSDAVQSNANDGDIEGHSALWRWLPWLLGIAGGLVAIVIVWKGWRYRPRLARAAWSRSGGLDAPAETPAAENDVPTA